MLPRGWNHEPAAEQPHRVSLHPRSALIGMFARNRLPKGHLHADTNGVVRLGTRLIARIAGLVLGLLVASANTTYETKSDELEELTANIALLDTTLAHYGPETNSARHLPNV